MFEVGICRQAVDKGIDRAGVPIAFRFREMGSELKER